MKPNKPGGAARRPTSLTLDVPISELIPFIQLSHNPSVHAYHTLKTQIEQCSPSWLAKFLDLGGLDAFLDSLCQLTGHKFTNFSDAVLQLDCIGCVKSVLSCTVGMQYMVDHNECVCKLIQALDTPNTLPKKQVFELLTAIAIYSKQGHTALLDALRGYKKLTNQHHVFSLLLNELKSSETATYRVTLMSLLNVILRGHTEVKERSRIREQLVGLGMLDVMSYIRKDDRDPELAIQFEVFDNDKHLDEELMSVAHSVDVTCHRQLFDVLYNKMLLRPGSSHLLHMLQDLVLAASNPQQQSEALWQVLSQTVHHIVQLPADELSMFSLHKPCDTNHKHNSNTSEQNSNISEQNSNISEQNSNISEQNRNISNQNSQHKDETCSDSSENNNKQQSGVKCLKSSNTNSEGNRRNIPDDSNKVKPIGARVSLEGTESDKLVLYGKLDRSDDSTTSSKGIHRQDSGISVTSPYDNVTDGAVFRRQGSGRGSFGYRDVNKPSRKPTKAVKPVLWEPLRVRDTQKPLSVWRMVSERSYRQKVTLDYTELEDEFEQTISHEGVNDAGDEIHLLEPEESLQLNLLLARLEAMPEELADAVIEGDTADLTPHGMKLLLDAIPHTQQIARIQASEVPRFTLAPAEQFLAFLAEHADYPTLLQGLKFKVTFQSQFPVLQVAFESLISSCRDVLHHHGLRDFIRVMLDAGNFLNAGHNLEPAAGVKLSSWCRLLQVKGQGHSSNLLTYIMQQVEKQDDSTLMFVNDFPLLEKAAGFSLDSLKKEVTDLNMQMKHFLSQLSQSESKVREKYQDVIEEVKKDLAGLHSNIARLKGLSSQMALYFCEEEVNFDLQGCLRHLHEFIKAVKICQKTSVQSAQQEAAAAGLKKEREQKMEDAHIMKYFGKKADLCSSFARAQTDSLVDHLLEEIHRGNIAHHHDNQEVQTPDFHDKLGMSVIQRIVSTPIDDLDIDLESSSFIFQAAGSVVRPTYVDRVERVTDCHYHRDNQRETASFVAEGEAPRASNETLEDTLVSNYQPGALAAKCRPNGIPAEEPAADIMIYPKILTPTVWKRGHTRCRSDLDGSRITEDKWKTYEKHKDGDGFPATGDQLQSNNVITSLGLEARVVRITDIPCLPNRKVFIIEPEKPVKDKKKKVGFFQRLSQAVLRPRNTNINQGQGQEEGLKDFNRGSKRWSGRVRKSRKSIDKENMIVENLV